VTKRFSERLSIRHEMHVEVNQSSNRTTCMQKESNPAQLVQKDAFKMELGNSPLIKDIPSLSRNAGSARRLVLSTTAATRLLRLQTPLHINSCTKHPYNTSTTRASPNNSSSNNSISHFTKILLTIGPFEKMMMVEDRMEWEWNFIPT
jgi:hypothetical protein